MVQTYKIVEFSDTGEVAVVVSSWLTPRKAEVFWPPYKEQTAFDKALKRFEASNETWETYPIARIFYETANLEKANEKLKLVEESSNLESDIDDSNSKEIVKRKRKIKRKIYSSDEDENIPRSIHKRPPKIKITKAQQEPPNQEEPHCSTAEQSIPPVHSPVRPITANYLHSTPKQTLEASESNETDFKTLILRNLSELKEQNKVIIAHLRNLKQDSPDIDEEFSLPITSKDDLEKLEQELTKEKERKLVQLCSKFGGDGTTAKTNRILKELLSDQLAATYSFYGKRTDKSPFCNLKLKSVIIDAVKRSSVSATDTDIESAIKVWLKHAPQRLKLKQKEHS